MMKAMRRIVGLILTLGLCAVALAGVSAGATRKVIIETDAGADDACALMLAAKSPEIDILGVTVLSGNADLEQGTRNALAALELVGCDAPVFKGADRRYGGEEINAFSVFGKDGMGDCDLVHPRGEAREQGAVDFMLESIRQNPDEVEIILLGPATDIALAMDREPGTMRRVKRIWSLGTTGLGPGNASPVAEFNVYLDAPAYRRMLDFGIPVTVVGLDMCDGEAKWTNAQFEALEASGGTGQFITRAFSRLREIYSANGSVDSVMNCDSVAVLSAVEPDFVRETITCHGSCQTEPGEPYAEVIFYRQGFTYDVVSNDFDYNVTLVTAVDGAHYFDRFVSRVLP